MVHLEVFYNISTGEFSQAIVTLKKFWTPKVTTKDGHGSAFRECMGEIIGEIRDLLTDNIDRYDRRTIPVNWAEAGWYAMELGIFPIIDYDEAEKIGIERYWIPTPTGGNRVIYADFIGRANPDDPLRIRFRADLTRNSDRFYLLMGWYNQLKQDGFDTLIHRIREYPIKSDGITPTRIEMLEWLPKTAEEFERKIEEERLVLEVQQYDASVSLLRFYWDFFGKPIGNAGYEPSRINCTDSVLKENLPFNLDILPSELELITRYPSLSREEIFVQIHPKLNGTARI